MAAASTKRTAALGILGLALSVTLTSCATTDNVDAANRAPVANAGVDTTAAPGDVVTLDGSGSIDPDGDDLIYRWELTKPEGSSASLSSANFVQTSFQPDLPGTYSVVLIVSDGELDSPPDQVSVTVESTGSNRAPTAAITGSPQLSAAVGVELVLDASQSADPDGDDLAFDWSLDSRPDGSVVDLTSAGGAEARITPDVAGDYAITLVVSDGVLQSNPVSVVVRAGEEADVPTASAGADQAVEVGTAVTLDGTSSIGANLEFAWSLVRAPIGSNAAIDDAESVTASLTPDVEGEYEARLIVTSNGVASSPDSCVITATAGNSGGGGPVANAGTDTSGATNTIITVDGSASSDPDSDPLTFAWSWVSRPTDSAAELDSSDQSTTSFIADRVGDYVLELSVTAGGDTDVDTVTVTVEGSNPGVEGDVVITEFLNDPANETLEEWFELYNPTDIEWDLNGCVLEDLDLDSVVIGQSLTIAPGEYITLAKSSMPGFTPNYDYSTAFVLANSSDEIIVTCGANEIANVLYDSSFPGSSTVSHQLKVGHYNETANDSAANWCAGTTSYGVATGTPGTAPDCN